MIIAIILFFQTAEKAAEHKAVNDITYSGNFGTVLKGLEKYSGNYRSEKELRSSRPQKSARILRKILET